MGNYIKHTADEDSKQSRPKQKRETEWRDKPVCLHLSTQLNQHHVLQSFNRNLKKNADALGRWLESDTGI